MLLSRLRSNIGKWLSPRNEGAMIRRPAAFEEMGAMRANIGMFLVAPALSEALPADVQSPRAQRRTAEPQSCVIYVNAA